MRILSPLISAWIGRGNYGDELLGYGLRLELYRSAKINQVQYYQAGNCRIYKGHDDRHILASQLMSNTRFGRIWNKVKPLNFNENNALFFGGGSVLHSENSIDWKSDLLKKFKKHHKRTWSITAGLGISLGPFESLVAEKKAADFLRRLDFVHCRDTLSVDFASSVGGCEVIDGRDLAFSVKGCYPDFFKADKVFGRVGISFILDPYLPDNTKEEHFKKMTTMVDFVASQGFKVLLFALYSAPRYSDDHLAARLFQFSKHRDYVDVHVFDGDVFNTLSLIASCNYFVSMRLHGLISAFLCGVPFLSLSKHPKVREFVANMCNKNDVDVLDLNSHEDDLILGLKTLFGSGLNSLNYSAENDYKFNKSIERLRMNLLGCGE